MVQGHFVNCYRARGVGKGGKSRGLSRGDPLLGRPYVVRGTLCEKISPVGGSRLFDAFEVTKHGLSRDGVGVGGLKFFGLLGGLRELLPKGGQERGPPSFGPWGGARAGRGGLYRHRQRGEGRGEPLVELIGRGSIRGGRDLPVFEFVSEARPVNLLPARSWFLVVGGGGTQGDQDRCVVRSCRGLGG